LRCRCARPRCRFGDGGADVNDEQCRRSADDEHRAPAEVGEDGIECDRCEQKTDCVALLQHAGKEAAPLGRQRLERERRTDTPLAPHRNSVKTAQQ